MGRKREAIIFVLKVALCLSSETVLLMDITIERFLFHEKKKKYWRVSEYKSLILPINLLVYDCGSNYLV